MRKHIKHTLNFLVLDFKDIKSPCQIAMKVSKHSPSVSVLTSSWGQDSLQGGSQRN